MTTYLFKKLNVEKMVNEDLVIDFKVADRTGYTENSVKFIIDVVSAYYKVSIDDVLSKKRKAKVLEARHICIYFILKYVKLTLSDTGKYFGVDHSTVYYTRKKINDHLTWDKKRKNEIQEIEKIMDFEGMVAVSKLNLSKDYYFIHLNKLKSIRYNTHKAILLTGFNDEEIAELQQKGFLPIGIEPREHVGTGWYILEKKQP